MVQARDFSMDCTASRLVYSVLRLARLIFHSRLSTIPK